ncbi:inducible metalloproteinase inhibitor protein-like [Leguminivora glycinivorella]|uniref:inducible metalloproteinase inhibitor protein-like n=1 Tax=Leguminivora glycinivorella TaxID=1035111 RepID=UPI00200DF758|nr:inducible metalloproteinase inhibitor protein-like [Leguminivora glycinivorella]
MSASKTILIVCLFYVLAVTLAQPGDHSCDKGEVYIVCGPSCPKTCESRGDTCKLCSQQCVKGCFCANDTFRAQDGSCVTQEQCPPRACTGENEVFDECPPTCPRTEKCENLWSKKLCEEKNCCTPQCRCKPGFYRNEQNQCISSQECIKKDGGESAGPEALPNAAALVAGTGRAG